MQEYVCLDRLFLKNTLVWLYFLHADIQCSDIISGTILMRNKKTVGISTVKWKT